MSTWDRIKAVVDGVDADLLAAQTRAADLETELEALQSVYTGALDQLDSANARITSLTNEIASLKTEIAELQAEIAELTAVTPVTQFGFWTPPAVYDTTVKALGKPGVYRYFPGTTLSVDWALWRSRGVKTLVLSTKPSIAALAANDPAAITAVVNQIKAIPDDFNVFWCLWHEPEDDTEKTAKNPNPPFTPAQYRQAWKNLLRAAPKRPNLHPTTILMQYSFVKRNVADYIDAEMVSLGLEVATWDAYFSNTVPTVDTLLKPCVDFCKRMGLDWAIAEISVMADLAPLGSTRDAKVAPLLEAAVKYAQANGAKFVCWFEEDKHSAGGNETDWRISTLPTSAAAWKSLTAGK